MLELKNVSKFYYNKGIVSSGINKVNLKFDMGEFVAITGESGSGKSTLLNVLSGLDTYEEGEMFINGEETSHYTEVDYEEYRKKYIGNIFQNFNLVSSYTVYQNVELVLLINGYTRSSAKSKVIEILKKVDLYKYRHTRVSKLSGGMKQRVAIARCLAKDTPIIIADEPTGNLDSKNAKSVLKLLYEISKYKLVIVVTHNYEQISEYATRKITMHDGSVIEDVKLKNFNEVKEVKLSESKKTKFISNLRLGLRNTFNIPTKFLLLTFVYLFVLLSLVDSYSAFLELENNGSFYNGFFNEMDADKRIIVKKKDKTSFTSKEIESMYKVSNVKNVILNDTIYDYSVTLTDNNNIYLESNFMKISDFKGELTYGRMPENSDEIIIMGSVDNYYISDLQSDILNKTVSLGFDDESKKVKIVGIVTYEGYNWMVTSYVSDEVYDYVEPLEMKDYGTSELYMNSKKVYDYPNVKISDKVLPGEVYISEIKSYSCTSYNCNKDTVNLTYENIYFNKSLDLKVAKIYNRDNYKRIFGKEYDEVDTIFISSVDYDTLYKNSDVYQISLFVDYTRNIDETMKELTNYDVFSLGKVKSNTSLTQVLKIVKVVVLTILIVVLFFISYFVIKLIIKSRNKYYTTIRILGGSFKETKVLLMLELFNITNLVYLLFLVVSLLVKNGVIVNDYLSGILFYINLKEYIILYLVLTMISYLISSRYSRKIFKSSVITTYNMEV